MGRIFDALEKRKKDTALGGGMLSAKRTDEIEKDKNPPVLLSQDGCDPKLVTLTAPDSFDAELFKVLRAQILFPQSGTRKKSIMVTSAFPGEGKTFVAANLGVSIASGINEHVLLVDGDFRRPNLHKMLGYSNTAGLHEYLTDKKDLADLIIRTRLDKLSFLPAGSPSHNPSELLASNEMKGFLEEVRDRYDDRLIIIDAAPVQATAEASVLSNYVEGVILVVRSQKAPREMVLRTVEALGRNKILGVIFNGYSKSLKQYGKYYGNYYR
ncbi:MAG: polysaccharide biosynthesis tyrosine autokinase [Deltaproteobacteria bacterium]|nr:polysaccharide biosynthesis tyrosine autokinase [Deltaproteobacteria bacterium]